MSNKIANAIAIIGIACKFPHSENWEEYWKNIKEGKECIETLLPEELTRLDIDYDTLHDDNYVNRCSCITDIDKFDADFFKISPREATYMDPQQRLMLEKAWEAVEDAGYNIDKMGGKVAIFASTSASSYFLQNMLNTPNFIEEAGGMKAVLHGLDKDHIATKIAYKLNFTGPAITVQSACSSSMVGTIMACQNLLTYQCDVALAGGVTINVPQKEGYIYEKGNVRSQDGYCRPFDEDASGTVFGSGVGCIVLKRLEDAINDNDRIYAIIRGGAVNNDGNDKVGYTAPGVRGQMEVISDALEFADINPNAISYVEAHGTATIMGDPIEVEAISKVYEQYTDKKQYCALGSVKANIGHLNSAAGVAGIIKTALLIKNRVIPPLINFRQENQKIDFVNTPFYINTKCKNYDGNEPMRAAVSSFGIGGTNGHIVMEEFCNGQKGNINKKCYLIPVSARDIEDLRNACQNLSDYISSHADISMADIERTLQCGRKAFDIRTVFVVENHHELLQGIHRFLTEGCSQEKKEDKQLKIVISSTNKCKYPEIKELYDDNPLFRKNYDSTKRFIKDAYTDDVWKNCQEAMSSVVTQIAMIRTWKELGIETEIKLNSSNESGTIFAIDLIQMKEHIAKFLECSVHDHLRNDELGVELDKLISSQNIYQEFLSVIANWWMKGKNICWEKWICFDEQKIISLPTYPFKRNSYWSFNTTLKEKEKQPEKEKIRLMEVAQHERPDLSTPYVAPIEEMHERLIDIWGELLGIKGIGIEDDFFELGGHSLMATQLIAAIKNEFLVELEIFELFDCPTVLRLADMITNKLAKLIDSMDINEIDAYLEMENNYGS